MIILVTGTAGFIGFHVAKALLERGDEVVGIDNFNDYYDVGIKEARNAILTSYSKFKVYRNDISDKHAVQKIFAQNKIDKVCNLAAQAGVRYSIENPYAYEQSNALGFLNILEAARHAGVKDIVFASSSSVYGGNKKNPSSVTDNVDKPISLYAATKKYNELVAHAYHKLFGMNLTGLRFFTVYGPWGRPDMALFLFTKAILEDKPINVYNYGNMRRDFTYITDIVAGVIAALDKSFPYEIFNLGNSNPTELKQFIKLIEDKLGKKAIRNEMPMQPGDVPESFADIDKSRDMLGFDPKVKVEEGISKFIDWYLAYFTVSNGN